MSKLIPFANDYLDFLVLALLCVSAFPGLVFLTPLPPLS